MSGSVMSVRTGASDGRSVTRRRLAIVMAAFLAATFVLAIPARLPHVRAIPISTLYAVTGAGGDTPGGGPGGSGSLSALYTLSPADASVLTGPTAITINAGATQLKHILGLAVEPSTGVLYGVMNGQQSDSSDWGNAKLITINPATGAATVVGSLGAAACDNGLTSSDCYQISDIAFDPFGKLYAWNVAGYGSQGLQTINTSTGRASLVGLTDSDYGMGLAINSAGSIYMAGTWDPYIWHLGRATGFPYDNVVLGDGTTQQITNALAFDPFDTLFAGKRTSTGFTLFTLDPSDGTLTSVGSNAVTKIGAIAFDTTSVTPPASADLSIDKTVDDPTPAVGQTITFTLTVSNAGPDTATGVEVTDHWANGSYTFVSASGDGSYDDSTGVWTVGTILNGASASIDIDVTVNRNEALAYRNEARITADDTYDPDSDVADPNDGTFNRTGDIFDSVTPAVYDPAEDFGVALTVNGPTHPGAKTKSFRVTITNLGTVPMNVQSYMLNVTVYGVPEACKAFSKTLAPGAYVRTTCTYSPANIGFGVGASVTYEAVIDVPLDGNSSNDTADFFATAT